MKKVITPLLMTVFVILCHVSLTFAGGFLIFDHDPAASGMSNAYTAQADRPSAVLYNPAGINQIEGTAVAGYIATILPRSTFRNSTTGNETATDRATFVLPNFFITHKISDKFSAGFGFFNLFGLAIDWPENWEGRYITTFAEIKTYYLNPVVSWQIHPRLSVAAGYNYVFSQAKLQNAIDLSGFGLPDGRSTIKGDANGHGFNVGLLYHITDNIDFGFSYRSKVELNYEGNVRLGNMPPIIPDSDGSFKITLPSLLGTGLAVRPFEKWLFEFDFYWLNWSVFKRLAIDFDNPLTPDQSFPKEWHDSYTYALGVKYQATKSLCLRAGYMYDTAAVPERTLDPILPDANSNIIAIGAWYQYKGWSFDAAYRAILYETRSTNSNIRGFNGSYGSTYHIITLGLHYIF
jgi:long-chain fatty acid transport protein